MVERSRASLGDPPGAVGGEPVAGDDELRQRVRQFGDQRDPRGGGQIFQHQHRFPDRGEMAVTLDDAVPRKTAPVRHRHFRSARVPPQRCRLRRSRHRPEAGRLTRRAMAHCISPLPVAMMSTRSASIKSGECSSTGSATDGWSSDSACTMAAGASALRENTSAMAWRTSGEASSSSINSAPSAAARSSSTEIGNQPGARQRTRRLRPLACRSGPDPTDELPNDHGPCRLTQPRTTP